MANRINVMRGLIAMRTTLIAAACAIGLTGCGYSYTGFDEPELRGRIVDEQTQQAVPGVVVHGYYAVSEGSLAGGETIKAVLRVFEVETDANGVFVIPRWQREKQWMKGEPRDRFPILSFYKDGYKNHTKGLRTLRDWSPANKVSTVDVNPSGDVYDWTARPHLLVQATTERQRYDAIVDSNDSYASTSDCGWEQHAKLLLAQHVAKKGWILRNIPVQYIDADGYGKDTYFHSERHYDYFNRTAVDKLIQRAKQSPQAWMCSNPEKLFGK
jgi:hypothetical protein